ncbi:MAG: PA0069 family radical SAM protein [Planctomycetaceae bacterium]
MRHGSQIDPPNRFAKTQHIPDADLLDWDDEFLRSQTNRQIEYLPDQSRSIISENQSPDVPFRYSLNPYRGCIHGCAYCYARPGHEYLGFSAGLDFETKIVVKHDAPQLLKEFLAKPDWKAEQIAFSGVTDCYQPAEREFQLTRQCLQVALECRQPVGIVTKNALVIRDLDLLSQMAALNLVHVFVSITTLDPALARDLEPRTSIPHARLRAIRLLSEAGVPVGVMTAPVIPGLNDSELPAVLQAASAAGAKSAGYILLRLPLSVEPVFQEWLQRCRPSFADKVLNRIRETRSGQLSSGDFGTRMRGTGQIADQIQSLFQLFRRKHGLDQSLPAQDHTQFRPPISPNGQQFLF